MSEAMSLFDRRLLARRRARAARAVGSNGKSAPDFLLGRAADDIMDRLAVIKRAFPVAVNLGAHNGLLGARLRASGKHDLVIDTDSVAEMLALGADTRVLADEEALPFRDAALDLVVSALALQFVNDLPGTLVQLRRALKPDGLLIAALLGGDTLMELRQAFLAAEEELEGGASPRVAPVGDLRALGGLLQRAGFGLPVVDSDRVTVSYAHPLALMQELRAMGATNVLHDRRRTPLRRTTLMRACEIYAERFSRPDGRVLATFEIITLTAWVPHESQQKPLAPGSAKTRLADALSTKETKLKE
jgi:SAM-dependent methyltransferase